MPFSSKLAEFITRQYRLVTIFTLLFTLALAAGTSQITLNPDFRTFFGKDNPQLIAFEELEADFNKRDTITFIIEPLQGDVLSKEGLVLIQQLTDLGWRVPWSRRVDSLSNHQKLTASADDILTEDLLPDGIDLSDQSTLDAIRAYALNEESLKNNLLGAEGAAAIVNVTLALPDNDPAATREIVDFVRSELADLSEQYRDTARIHLFGTTMMNISIEEAIQKDLVILFPLTIILIYALVYFLLRSFVALFLVISTVMLSTISVFGFFGWTMGVLSPIAVGTVPSIVMIIAVADCIHLLVSFFHEMSTGKERRDAVQEAIRINFTPMLVTSVTTAIGLFCLNFSEAPPYRLLGNMGAVGSILAFLLTVTLVPALLCWLPITHNTKAARGSNALYEPMEKLASFIINHRVSVAIATLVLLLACITGLPRIELTERWHDYYDDSFDIKQAINFQDKHLNGANFIQYRVSAGESAEESGINKPEFLRDLKKLHQWLAQQNGVKYVDGILPSLEKIHQLLETGSETITALPQTRERAAQNFLLYEMSLPLGLGLDEFVNIERSATRVGVFLSKTDSRSLLGFDQGVRDWARQNAPALNVSEGSGLDMVFAHISERNMVSLLQGVAVALVLISLLMIFVLRDVKLGLISLVPNLAPSLAAYGIWAYVVGYVDLGLSVVACMSLGLVVDDTVHFLSKYHRARKEQGKNAADAIRYAFGTVGSAMLVTTVVLAAGFSLLVLSPFSPTWAMGGLLSLTIVLALIFDFLLLPPLLLAVDKE